MNFAYHQYHNIPFDSDDFDTEDSPSPEMVEAGPIGDFVDSEESTTSEENVKKSKKKKKK